MKVDAAAKAAKAEAAKAAQVRYVSGVCMLVYLPGINQMGP